MTFRSLLFGEANRCGCRLREDRGRYGRVVELGFFVALGKEVFCHCMTLANRDRRELKSVRAVTDGVDGIGCGLAVLVDEHAPSIVHRNAGICETKIGGVGATAG